MYRCLLILLGAAASAQDEALKLALQAQRDFDRVELSARPALADTIACSQSQAAAIATADRVQLPLLHFRKGYCALVRAGLTGKDADYRDAAADFARAEETWKARTSGPASSAARVLAAIASLRGGTDEEALPAGQADLAAAILPPECPESLMASAACREILGLGRIWLAWMAVRDNRLAQAEKLLAGAPASPWTAWVAGRQAQEARRWSDVVEAFQKALEGWRRPRVGVIGAFGPPAEEASAWRLLGRAQFHTGDFGGALTSLDAALKLRPQNARAVFERARVKERLGRDGLRDYQLASRTSFANVADPNGSAEAHFYRGVWLYRRKEFGRAESEFASALNFDPPAELKPEIIAWWRLAAVAAGACHASAEQLRQSLGSLSPFFPREEAESLLAGCSAVSRHPAL